MQFIKEYIPDKRWQTGLRPVVVKTNLFMYVLWSFFSFLKNITSHIKSSIESTFKEIEPKEMHEHS